MFVSSLSHRVFLGVSGAGIGVAAAVGLALLADPQAQVCPWLYVCAESCTGSTLDFETPDTAFTLVVWL